MSVCLSVGEGGGRIFTKLTSVLGLFVRRFGAEFHENPADSLVTGSQTERQTDGRDFHKRRYFSSLCKERPRRKTRS